MNKQIIGLLVHNHPGVLLRVTSLFTRRGFNIDSLTVSPAGIEGYSRMTIRMSGDDDQVEQFINQMLKIVDVKTAEVLPEESSVAMELLLVKVSSDSDSKNDIISVFGKAFSDIKVEFPTFSSDNKKLAANPARDTVEITLKQA